MGEWEGVGLGAGVGGWERVGGAMEGRLKYVWSGGREGVRRVK